MAANQAQTDLTKDDQIHLYQASARELLKEFRRFRHELMGLKNQMARVLPSEHYRVTAAVLTNVLEMDKVIERHKAVGGE